VWYSSSLPSGTTELVFRRRREGGIDFHILSSVAFSRIRDRMAEALCIWRRLRSRAVIGLELLLLESPDLAAVLDNVLVLAFVDRLRAGPTCGRGKGALVNAEGAWGVGRNVVGGGLRDTEADIDVPDVV